VWLQQGPFNAKGKLTEFIKAAASYVYLVEQELDVSGGSNGHAGWGLQPYTVVQC
jgi:hypothetical protein